MKPYYKLNWAAAQVAFDEFTGKAKGIFPTLIHRIGYIDEYQDVEKYKGLHESRRRELRKEFKEADDRVYNKILSIMHQKVGEGYRTPRVNKARALKSYSRHIYLMDWEGKQGVEKVQAMLKEAEIADKNRQGPMTQMKEDLRNRTARASITLVNPRLEHIYRRLLLIGGPDEPDADMLLILEEVVTNRARRKVSLIPMDRKSCQAMIDWLHDYADKYHPRRGPKPQDIDIDQANALLDAQEETDDEAGIDIDI